MNLPIIKKLNWRMNALSLLLMAILCLIPQNAQGREYFYDAALMDLPPSTTVALSEISGTENICLRDVSKNTALIPPPFGSPQAAQPNNGIIISANTGTNYVPAVPPILYSTEQTSIFYTDGYLGTLQILKLNLTVKVYEGENNLEQGLGHFADTPIFNGNVAIAGHNRGVNSYFSDIHTLSLGDKISYTTKGGTRTYQVSSIKKIKDTDFTFLAASTDNRLTLLTCVKNEPNYRWCVQAKEV